MNRRRLIGDMKKTLIAVIITIFTIVAGILFLLLDSPEEKKKNVDLWEIGSVESNTENDNSGEPNIEETGKIFDADVKKVIIVHICGEVKAPGVYSTDADKRVVDIVELAGGFTQDAAEDYVNLAQYVTDGQKIFIPSKKEVENGGIIPESPEYINGNDKVNINKASKEELMSLTGIGESRAESIIKYREENGGFKSKEELKNIDGIKDGLYSKIQDFIITN